MIDDPCSTCGPAQSRRHFLEQISTAVIGAVVGTQLGTADAAALPMAFVTGARTGADERTYPIPTADGATIDADAEVIVVRFQQRVYAFNLACPHQNTALKWRQNDLRFQCPKHQSKYQPDGTFISGRATRNMDRFAVRRSADSLVVDLTRLLRSDQQQAEWSAAVIPL
jgi:Rieske Fe-S protein